MGAKAAALFLDRHSEVPLAPADIVAVRLRHRNAERPEFPFALSEGRPNFAAQ